MSRALKIIVTILTCLVLAGLLLASYMALSVSSSLNTAKDRANESLKEAVCHDVNFALVKYYNTHNEYPETLEQWAPETLLQEPPYYESKYERTGTQSFVYTVTLRDGKDLIITENDLLDPGANPEIPLSQRCKGWVASR